MKKLTLLLAAGALWLFLAAVPTLADGGPHVKALNSGSGAGSTLTADGCAGCHRAHTAQGLYLIKSADEETLCLSCHGDAGTGASTNVESGVQYTLASRAGTSGTVLGALRGGGFITARLDSANPARIGYNRTATDLSYRTKVSVLSSGQAVTSSHLGLAAGVVTQGIAWGNGAVDSTASGNPGGTVEGMTCASCHNPHGNGNYRILNPIPAPETVAGDTFVPATTGVNVTDAALPGAGDARNYTVIQVKGTVGTPGSFLLYASQVNGTYANTAGDYFHRTVPWDPQVDYTTVGASTGTTMNDAPNGDPANFNTQINAWCVTCHTRYLSSSWSTNTTDTIFKYRHSNTSNKPCTTCHVAHGTNAAMPGGSQTQYSNNYPYPGGVVLSDSSRLLKIDNRGTCQACHDPTNTSVAGVLSGTTPVPYVP